MWSAMEDTLRALPLESEWWRIHQNVTQRDWEATPGSNI